MNEEFEYLTWLKLSLQDLITYQNTGEFLPRSNKVISAMWLALENEIERMEKIK